MDLTHRFSVPAPLEQAWRAINHPPWLDACFPGVTIDAIDGDAFTGSIKVKLGPIGLVYAGEGRYVERDADAHRIVLESRGTDRRGNGTAVARVVARLHANGDGTDIDVTTELTVTGRPAQFGDHVIADVSDKLFALFASGTADRFASGLQAPPVPVLDVTGPAPSEPETLDDLDVIEETIELGEVPEEVDGPADLGPPEDQVPAAAAPSAPPSPPPGPYRYAPPSDLSEPDVRAVVTLLRRVGPALGVVSLVVVVLVTIIRRVRGR